jgi:hypothetical protein
MLLPVREVRQACLRGHPRVAPEMLGRAVSLAPLPGKTRREVSARAGTEGSPPQVLPGLPLAAHPWAKEVPSLGELAEWPPEQGASQHQVAPARADPEHLLAWVEQLKVLAGQDTGVLQTQERAGAWQVEVGKVEMPGKGLAAPVREAPKGEEQEEQAS